MTEQLIEEAMKPPVFITGTQRSGTTLICRMLEAHPDLYIRNEIPRVTQIFSPSNNQSRIMEGIDQEMTCSFGCDMKTFLKKSGKKRWGLKDPDLRFSLDHLAREFSDSKIIFIIRDGRAVANSFLKNRWGMGVNVYYGALHWKEAVGIQERFMAKHPERCYLIRFEDLLKDHETELKRLCEFIDEPYSEKLTFYYKENTRVTKREQSKNVFKKPDMALSTRWQAELSRFQINTIETVAGKTLLKYGYPLFGQEIRISGPLRMWFYLQQKIWGEVQLQYQWRFKRFLNHFKQLKVQ